MHRPKLITLLGNIVLWFGFGLWFGFCVLGQAGDQKTIPEDLKTKYWRSVAEYSQRSADLANSYSAAQKKAMEDVQALAKQVREFRTEMDKACGGSVIEKNGEPVCAASAPPEKE